MNHIDSIVVGGYFVVVITTGYWLSRRHRQGGTSEFVTGRRTRTWYQTALALLGMAVDPTYMGITGLGFLWGMYLTQWTGVHVWFTTWFAAMFFLPIYWRSQIVTTPEFLEKRFNVQCRVFFSLAMVVILVVTLTTGLYLGALLLQNLLGWTLGASVLLIAAVAGFYVILGGAKTVLVLDSYQGVFLLVTLLIVAAVAVHHAGGIGGVAAIEAFGNAGTRLPSLVPPLDGRLTSGTFFPAPAILLWATVAGLSWLACNFGMAQRILAARTEYEAQRSLLLLGVLAAVVTTCTFLIGVAMRHLHPELKPDEAFLFVMLRMFPEGAGVRGFLAAGMMAALLSTADGLLTGSSALLLEDLYLRFVRPSAGDRERKLFAQAAEAGILVAAAALIPLLMNFESAMTFLQDFYGNILGVVVALYLVGMFSRRATPRAAFGAMLSGVLLAVMLDRWAGLNFAYVGFLSFLWAVLAALAFSRLEAPIPPERLANLTVHTLPDAPGPWVGLKAWPGLWKWAMGMIIGWIAVSAAWESYVRTR